MWWWIDQKLAIAGRGRGWCLAAVVLVVALGVLGWTVAGGFSPWSTGAPGRASPVTAAASGSRTSGPRAADPIGPRPDRRRSTRLGSEGGSSTAAALALARRAAVAMWSVDGRDVRVVAPPGLRPLVTSALWRQLEASPGAPAAQAQEVAEREVDRVGPVVASLDDVAADGVGVDISAAVTVSERGRVVATGRDDAGLFLVHGPTGWRVAKILL
jgi:hypothetical protein